MTFQQRWADLMPVGRERSTGGYRRFAWTREDATLREWFAGECARLGLDLTEDRAGNQWAFWWPEHESAQALPAVAVGSHLDSVPDGGAYDGPLGVVSALSAVEALQESGFRPSRPVAVASFGDEEGARFGIACAGSRVLTGVLDADTARGLTDADGVSMGEALTRAGRDAGAFGSDHELLGRLGVFVELHVEQGRAMVDLPTELPSGEPVPFGGAVGIGTDIWPHGRWRVDLPGTANHAGTTRLVDRDDAMLKYADTVLAARRIAAARGCVATTGKVRVEPNGVNAIPSHVTGWLDSRGADEAAVTATVDELSRYVREQHGATVTQESWTATTPFTPAVINRLAGVLGPVPQLGTGAGHDAGVLATAGIPSAMLFVRNPTGVSHSPAEHAEEADCLLGVEALTAVVRSLAGDGQALDPVGGSGDLA